MPVHIPPNGDGTVILELIEGATHVTVSIEIPKVAIRQHRRFFESLLAIATRREGGNG
jgi:hypothetical protein